MAILVRRQLLGIAAAASALVGATYLGNAAISLLKTGAAYKAKLLCSEHFVAGRQFEDATNELEVDDLRPLRFIRASVDSALSGVSARVLHLRREARYHVEYGCTLTPTDESPPEPAERRGVERTSGEATRSGTWASGSDLTQKSLAEVLDEAFTDVGSRQPKRTRAVVVLQHGKIITERYATGFGPETPLVGWSLAKSVLNALVGVAVRDGLLELEAPVPLQSWSRPGDRRQEITVGSLLRMSSGLEFDEDQTDPSSDIVHMLFEAPDMAAFAASKILAAPPGTTWSY